MHRLAPAKINLNLGITGRRDDGYHLLHSVMVFTQWGDDITITPAEVFSLTVDGPYAAIFTEELLSTDRGASNLIVRAVYLMADKAGKNPAFHIHVTKNIPAGAGLGGGSSDAAAVMHMLNDYYALDLSMADLCAMGLTLGAELPVCLHAPSPCVVTGIGDKIEMRNDLPALHLLIVWPDAGLMTKDVFGVYANHPYKPEAIDSVPHDGRPMDWIKADGNHLTAAAIELCPQIGELLSDLQESDGCIFSRMSGSGSACFGVFDTKEAAEAASENFKNCVVTTTRNQA